MILKPSNGPRTSIEFNRPSPVSFRIAGTFQHLLTYTSSHPSLVLFVYIAHNSTQLHLFYMHTSFCASLPL